MAVVGVSTFTVKPDRFEDELEEARKAKTLLEKIGAKNFRLLAAMVAGEQTGSLAMIYEADDFAGWGALMDKFLGDREGMALMAVINTTGGPVPGFQGAIWVDVPL